MNNELLKILDSAIIVAIMAHAGQTDKAGLPYILHPIRVMMAVNTIPEKIVAILHDVLEDTEITPEILISRGIPEYLVCAIKMLTKDPNKKQTYNEYLINIKTNEIATNVKIADMRDNSDLLRFHDLEEKHLKMIKKYHRGIKMLTKDLDIRTRL